MNPSPLDSTSSASSAATAETGRLTRRRFLHASAGSAAGLMAGVSTLAAAELPARKLVFALMGAGGRGSDLCRKFAAMDGVEFKYICDPNGARGGALIQELEKQQAHAPQRIADIRRALDDADVQAVVIATPEQWHALATVWACQAGKDVYVEKNASLTIWEGRKMIEAARKYRRVVQVGLQNRSAPYAVSAREYIRSGQLGKVVLVQVYNLLPGGPWKPQLDGTPPPGLDWDLWLGPAPEVPFNPGRLSGWGDFWDYEGGVLAGDGCHQIDLTRIALGDPPHPRSVYCTGGRLAFPDQRETPDLQVASFDYGEFRLVVEHATFTPYMKKFPPEVRFGTQWPHWPQSSCRVEIYGTRRMMLLGRHGCGWQVFEGDGKVVAEDKGHFPDKWHLPNFIDCIRSRQQPNADIEQAHYSACLPHLANVSYRTGQTLLHFDGANERFTNSSAANQFLKPAYRKHYRVPEAV
jgi:predicted dehydrogenase